MNRVVAAALAAIAVAAMPALAQPRTYQHNKNAPFRSEVRILAYHFDNFYQAADRDDYEPMNAGGVEYRAAYRPSFWKATDLYGHANYTWWSGRDLVGSYGARVGVVHDTEVHDFNVFLQQNENRPSFEVGNTYARADTTFAAAEYGYRFRPDWEVGAELEHDRQSYETAPARNNRYFGYGASIRYRGWEVVSPTVGFTNGRRTVSANEAESYDADDYYIELTTEAIRPLWLNLAYHSRGRSYSIDNPTAANFGREESGPRWTATAAFRQTPRVSWNVYYSHESNDANHGGTDFTTNFVVVSVSYGL
jgi:hypothetical protein